MAGKFNLVIEQGVAFPLEMMITTMSGSVEVPRDLTGHVVKSQIKKTANDTGSLAEFILTNTLNTSGSINLALTSAQTEALELGTYVYDVIVKLGSETIMRPLNGVASVIPKVTD